MSINILPAFSIHTPPDFWLLLLPVMLYAEMHYRLKFLKGRLYKKEPEIVFDTPRRIQTENVPVVLLVKDAHWFPIILKQVTLTLSSPFDELLNVEQVFTENSVIDQQWFSRVYYLDVTPFRNCQLRIDCRAVVECGGRTMTIRNDNYATLSHAPFSVFVDSEPLPAKPGWLWGDLHCHSQWTSDQVEFGLPPAALPPLASAMGLAFCSLVEHSYDLDDRPDSWTQADPQVEKWSDYLAMVQSINASRNDFVIIPGEEVSVDNGLGRNVHLAVLNNPEYFPGSGDGLENSIGFPCELSYLRVLENVSGRALVYAAHPFARAPIVQRLLTRRGTWNRHDNSHRLNGWQILNGQPGADFFDGRTFWIDKLLRGSHTYIYGGNDAHGNFNRFRQIRIPLLNMYEHEQQVFGEFLTGVKADLTSGPDGLTASLKTGPVIISNGPFVNIIAKDSARRRFETGQTLPGRPIDLEITALSTNYCGLIRHIKIFLG
ncbi:MAG: hypothetical protein V1681_07700, partial [Candidatus Neomarinimicrobiota bacterium]